MEIYISKNNRQLVPFEESKAREEWLEDLKDCPKIVTALDKLAAAAKKLLTYKADLLDYRFHNPAEEKLMRTVFPDLADLKIFSSGFAQSSWLIDKNDFGLPTAQFKRGAVYFRNVTSSHPYCFLSYINIVHDFAGGGTYGASNANFIRHGLVGCPAGK